jgi:N-acetylglucosamine-6-phosphate deacetylase
MSKLIIKNARVVLSDQVLENQTVFCENGKIKKIGSAAQSDESSARIIDAKGNFLAAGFIDLHIHGVHTYLVDNGPEEVAKICNILPMYGITGYLPTVCPSPKGKDAAFLQGLSAGHYTGAQVLGFHLEGPFLSLTGALPPEALGNADLERVENLIRAAKPYKAIFSISPEFEDITTLIPTMAKGNTPVFMTHTKANVSQTVEAIKVGACHATHFYDVFYAPEMTDPGVRPCGAVEAILASPNVSVDFILDGVHVDPIAVKMSLQCKGSEKVCLITDANVGAGMGAGRYKFGGTEVEIACLGAPARLVKCGGLAGSGLTMNLAVKNAVKLLGVELPLAVKMASANPAKVLRLENKGLIKEGFDADMVMLDDQFKVLKTIIGGQCCYECE